MENSPGKGSLPSMSHAWQVNIRHKLVAPQTQQTGLGMHGHQDGVREHMLNDGHQDKRVST
eukprot:1160581-Pelagomonas_calceolata.AAC.9